MEQIYIIKGNFKGDDHQVLINGIVLGTPLKNDIIKSYGLIIKKSKKEETTFFVFGSFDDEKAMFICIDKDNSTKSCLCTLVRDRDFHDGPTERKYKITLENLEVSIKMEALLLSAPTLSVYQSIKEEIDDWLNNGHQIYQSLIKPKKKAKSYIKHMKRSFALEEDTIAL